MTRRIALAALLACAAPAAVHAASQDFAVLNRTGYQIDSIHLSEAGLGQWGNDVIGRDTLLPGERLDVSFDRSALRCHWDLMVKYHDASKATWTDLDLCQISTVSLFWDPRTRLATARAQ